MHPTLSEGVNYRIEGTAYYAAYPLEPLFFQGWLVAGKGGRVVGVMMDQMGPSRFRGDFVPHDLGGGKMSFYKEYVREHPLYRGGSLFPIRYELSLSRSGGYSGIWTIPAGDLNDNRGLVTLAIVPRETSWPLLRGLFELCEKHLYLLNEPTA